VWFSWARHWTHSGKNLKTKEPTNVSLFFHIFFHQNAKHTWENMYVYIENWGAFPKPVFLCKTKKFNILRDCVCSLIYPACKVHVPYYLSALACLAVLYFSTLSQKINDSRKKVVELKSILVFSATKKYFGCLCNCLSQTFLVQRRTQRPFITVHWSSRKMPAILAIR